MKRLEKLREYEIKSNRIFGGNEPQVPEQDYQMEHYDKCHKMCNSIDNVEVNTNCMNFCLQHPPV